MSSLREAQLAMARYLRSPGGEDAPAGGEARRLRVYRELVYNNIEGFVSGGFPVLRSLYNEADWHALVRAFIAGHRCRTPYFLEISQEFIRFLNEDHHPRDCDPPFAAELAHYEWVELALDIAEDSPPSPPSGDISPLVACPRLSPLAWLLSYAWPVHRIGPGWRPQQATPTFLVVYRDREERVRFVELNPATAHLLEWVRDNHDSSGAVLLGQLAAELDADPAVLRAFGADQLQSLADCGILALERPRKPV
ncbi:MAG: DUF2063 domain-containing protein [Parahaliea sp.]